jgi:hypothetical protein
MYFILDNQIIRLHASFLQAGYNTLIRYWRCSGGGSFMLMKMSFFFWFTYFFHQRFPTGHCIETDYVVIGRCVTLSLKEKVMG